MIEIAFGLSLGVLLVAGLFVALSPAFPTGIVGTALIGGILLCIVAGVEWIDEVPRWRALITVLEAALAVWALAKWSMRGRNGRR